MSETVAEYGRAVRTVAALIALALYPPQTLLVVFVGYALSGPVAAVLRYRKGPESA